MNSSAVITPNVGHSAIVEITLIVGDQQFRVGQLGPDFLILEKPATFPPSNAELRLEIDGEKENWTVFLPKGVEDDTTVTVHGIRAFDPR